MIGGWGQWGRPIFALLLGLLSFYSFIGERGVRSFLAFGFSLFRSLRLGCPHRRLPFLLQNDSQDDFLRLHRIHFPFHLAKRNDRPYVVPFRIGLVHNVRGRRRTISIGMGLRIHSARLTSAHFRLFPRIHVFYRMNFGRLLIIVGLRYLTVSFRGFVLDLATVYLF